jgi:hypothetical protein
MENPLRPNRTQHPKADDGHAGEESDHASESELDHDFS